MYTGKPRRYGLLQIVPTNHSRRNWVSGVDNRTFRPRETTRVDVEVRHEIKRGLVQSEEPNLTQGTWYLKFVVN